MQVDIYMGVVYYQRLRHMVSDKSQARSTGPVDILTNQPVKGRKKGGGIRLGEMERDALIAHGLSFCLKERLLDSSDYSEAYICKNCGEMLGSFLKEETDEMSFEKKKGLICRQCNTGQNVKKVGIPFVMRYLANELAAMNIKLSFSI